MDSVQLRRGLVQVQALWGDPTRDQEITAVDALVCLTHVVGRYTSGHAVEACDVTPDGGGGTFTGEVTTVDALAVLSAAVGLPLPAHYRLE